MFSTPISAGWLPVFVACFLTSSLAAAEFPPVEKLPERAELPDALTMFDGTKVTTREQWYEQRRPELKALFPDDEEIQGLQERQ